MKDSKKEDIRITKTKRDLRAALMDLLNEKPFEKITVNDICTRAMINRMTFYNHYDDKYDLLNDLLIDFKKRIEKELAEYDPDLDIRTDPARYISKLNEIVFNECIDHRDIIRTFNNNELVLTMISTTVEHAVKEMLQTLNDTKPLRYSIDGMAAAIIGAMSFLVRHWINYRQNVSKTEFLGELQNFLTDFFNSDIIYAKSSDVQK